MIRRNFKKQIYGARVDRWALRLLNSEDPKIQDLARTFDYTQGMEELDDQWEAKDEYFLKYREGFQNVDPKYWISKMLHLNGSMTHKELWRDWVKDEDIDKERIYFRSQTHLKTWLLTMLEFNEIVRAGYSKREKRSLGFAVNTQNAFHSYHPSLIFSMDPAPSCYTQQRYAKYFELDEEDMAPQLGAERPEIVVE